MVRKELPNVTFETFEQCLRIENEFRRLKIQILSNTETVEIISTSESIQGSCSANSAPMFATESALFSVVQVQFLEQITDQTFKATFFITL